MIEDAVIRARKDLQARVAVLGRIEFFPPIENRISLVELSEVSKRSGKDLNQWVGAKFGDFSGQNCIYTLHLTEDQHVKELQRAFLNARANKSRGYALPRQNVENWTSHSLYVGRSRNVTSRLKQHLLHAPRQTYAINLSRWSGGLEFDVIVRVYKLKSDPVDAVIQDIEDALWDQEQPCLGKRGGR